mmetsp:Transcript_28910/g.56537  ORF Transcript_28910/g.56537 Transcript_28910/m.56537 type:complete len:87 (-) Transcript_28910:220-480(-)
MIAELSSSLKLTLLGAGLGDFDVAKIGFRVVVLSSSGHEGVLGENLAEFGVGVAGASVRDPGVVVLSSSSISVLILGSSWLPGRGS